MSIQYPLSAEEIRSFLPHRFPFLLVDRILKIDPIYEPGTTLASIGSAVSGIKNISISEPVFTGHFPNYSIYPGVMMLEAIAQVSSFIFYPHFIQNGREAFECTLLAADRVRWRRPVVPGDQVLIESVMTKKRGTVYGFKATAKVNGQVASEAQILANLSTKKRTR
jgi:3-hydroxyacyl-[acyl-carrier-protein] dehydratase